MLSFYLDYSVSEAFQDSSIEFNNIVRHAREKGFRLNTNPSSSGILSFYIMVPALSTGLGPNYAYAPTLRRGSQFGTVGGNQFLLIADVDFSDSNNEVVVSRVNEISGVPTYYAIKAFGRAVSGRLEQKTVSIGSFEKFLKVRIGDERVAEIISVYDAEGHEYYEVPFLAQDVIYRSVINRNSDKEKTPRILKPTAVPRRFVVERELNATILQFGFGTDSTVTDIDVLDPSNTTLQLIGRDYISDTSFDPTKLIQSDRLGIAPADTELTITYRENTANNVNASVGTIENVTSPRFKFVLPASLVQSEVEFVTNSLEVTNESRFNGDISIPSTEEIKIRSNSYFATQNRAVSDTDYKALAYAMPGDFGALKRVNIFHDPDSFRRNLNMYVVAEGSNGYLEEPNATLKTNLKNWISLHKMINDSVDIIDARIVNFGIEFDIVAEGSKNRFDVLQNAITVTENLFRVKMEIGEPILISKIYNAINEADGVEDVIDVRVVPKTGLNYSQTRFNFDAHISEDGRMINGYENLIFELKIPSSDIKGSIK